MAAATPVAPSTTTGTFGVVTLDGKQYIERPQIFPMDVTIAQPNQVLTHLRLSLPGVAAFLLKGMSRDIIGDVSTATPPFNVGPAGMQTNVVRRFRFKMSNTEGSTSYFSGGLGVIDDRAIDVLCFGSGQFPFPLTPPVPFSASANILIEVEDITGTPQPPNVIPPLWTPYTIMMAFHGAYLIPLGG